jgi:hypothetical protein
MWLTLVLKALPVVLLTLAASLARTITLKIPITQIAHASESVAPFYANDLAVLQATDNSSGRTLARPPCFLRIDRLGGKTPKR